VTPLIVIIYLAFIGLGLPDSLLGSAWPVMHIDLGAADSSAGIASLLITLCTIVSSLFSGRVIAKFGTGRLAAVSTLVTALSLFGMSFSNSLWLTCALAIPFGLGAGSVDAGLNGYVAENLEVRHMNWLHSFWGLGAAVGPVILSLWIAVGSWRGGYRTVGGLQLMLALVLLFSLPLWKRSGGEKAQQESVRHATPFRKLFRLPGAIAAFLSFLFYCALETTVGLWGATYLVGVQGMKPGSAAGVVSLYYAGIMLGRLAGGFLNAKLPQKRLMRIGTAIIVLGVAALILPLGQIVASAGLLLIGLGCAPIYPGLMHETPENFGSEHSQSVVGAQQACAYTGSALAPLLFGYMGGSIGYGVLPYFCAVLLAGMIVSMYRLHKRAINN
jgi:fucose permease